MSMALITWANSPGFLLLPFAAALLFAALSLANARNCRFLKPGCHYSAVGGRPSSNPAPRPLHLWARFLRNHPVKK